jgi:pilus assembly protein CpaE
VFVRDRESEAIVRQSLGDLGVGGADFVSGGIEAAIAQLAQQASPRLLVVDVSGVADPAARLDELAEVCEPGTGVVVIGDVNDIALYRNLRTAGVVDYFFKPLVYSLVKKSFNAVLTGATHDATVRTGKLIVALSARNGAGATTIATTTAWHLAEERKRRVVLVDLDLQFGDAALQLDTVPSHALREALEHPERVDDLFLDRGVIHITERLGLLASLEPLTDDASPNESAVMALLDNLLNRYRYVFVDLPAALAPRYGRLLRTPGTCLLVSKGDLASARDVARWREAIGPNSPERSVLHVLNQHGALGSLPDEEFNRAAGQAPDIVIPYAREIAAASTLGVKGIVKSAILQRGLTPLISRLSGDVIGPVTASMLRRLFG